VLGLQANVPVNRLDGFRAVQIAGRRHTIRADEVAAVRPNDALQWVLAVPGVETILFIRAFTDGQSLSNF
jgi:hypothetical protein